MQEPDRIIEDSESEEKGSGFLPGSCCKDDDNNGSTLQEKFRDPSPLMTLLSMETASFAWARGEYNRALFWQTLINLHSMSGSLSDECGMPGNPGIPTVQMGGRRNVSTIKSS